MYHYKFGCSVICAYDVTTAEYDHNNSLSISCLKLCKRIASLVFTTVLAPKPSYANTAHLVCNGMFIYNDVMKTNGLDPKANLNSSSLVKQTSTCYQ